MMDCRHNLLATMAILAIAMLHADVTFADDGVSGNSSGPSISNAPGIATPSLPSVAASTSIVGDIGISDPVGVIGSPRSAVSLAPTDPGGPTESHPPGLPQEAVKDIGNGSRTEIGAHGQTDQDRAFAANQRGEIISLKDVLREVSKRYDGKVIEINLRSSPTSEIYQMKIRTPDGTIKIVKMDARTGKIAGLFGF